MREALPADVPDLNRWVRVLLVLLGVGLLAVFYTAWRLEPDPRGLGTHQQLGLPPCTFYRFTRIPCPSCGMTTSFSHLAHGDVLGSLQANPAGTVLAAMCLVVIPWSAVSALLGRTWGIHRFEAFLARGVIVFITILLVSWGIRLGIHWVNEGNLFVHKERALFTEERHESALLAYRHRGGFPGIEPGRYGRL